MDAYSGDLAFLPLGGTGEIGMNLNLYRCGGKWLAIDCGIGFGGNDNPGGRDHDARPRASSPTGGTSCWPWSSPTPMRTTSAQSPIYGVSSAVPSMRPPSPTAVLRRKLDRGWAAERGSYPHDCACGGRIELPPFSLEFMPVAHSLPEAQALVIRTAYGTDAAYWRLED